MISTSKCPHCQKTGFEAVMESVKDYSFQLALIRCQWCKTAVAILDPSNVGGMLRDIKKDQKDTDDHIVSLSKKVDSLSLSLQNLSFQIQNLSLKLK